MCVYIYLNFKNHKYFLFFLNASNYIESKEHNFSLYNDNNMPNFNCQNCLIKYADSNNIRWNFIRKYNFFLHANNF